MNSQAQDTQVESQPSETSKRRFSIDRFLLSQSFLASLCLVVFALVLAITINGIYSVFKSFHMTAQVEAEQETIGILLILFGVFLEGREILTQKVFHTTEPEECPHEKETNHCCEYYGFMLLVIGLGIELIDQICALIPQMEGLVILLQSVINLPLNFWAIWLLVVAMYKLNAIAHKADKAAGKSPKSFWFFNAGWVN